MLAESNIITVLVNFMTYFMLHRDFREGLIQAGTNVANAMLDDMASPTLDWPPLYDLTIPDQIAAQGYAFEQHTITTPDGYILTAFRVPGKIGEPIVKGAKQPIYMQHGLIDDGGTWFFNDHTLDLSLELVDRGYDIWVTNSRGTAFSNQHTTYTVKDKEFWDFSFHEMGKYDVPSNLKYILSETQHDQVIYFGHS